MSGVKRDGLPLMLNPHSGQWPDEGQTWAAENGCFSARWSEPVWLRFIERMVPHQAKCLFAVAPDVYPDAAATWERSAPWLPVLRRLGYRAALVAQNGMEALPARWDGFDVLFIGGTTDWKLSEAAYRLVREAKAAGKWVHVGRVNSLQRALHFKAAGADSADGTILAFDPKRPVRRWQAELDRRIGLGI